jgi:hypothetical protein
VDDQHFAGSSRNDRFDCDLRNAGNCPELCDDDLLDYGHASARRRE